MPDGTEVEQGGPEDQATWKTCYVCEHTGPHVGTDKRGRNACMGSCGGIRPNPDIPRATLRKDPTTCPHDNVFAHVAVIKYEEYQKEGSDRRMAEIKINCADCDAPFHFIGVPGGLSPNQPMCSPFSDELRAPIVAGTIVQEQAS